MAERAAISTYNTIGYTHEGHIATITLNRPQVLNAVNSEMLGELLSAFQRAADDETVRVIVLNGAGDRAFCSGADLKEIQANGPWEQWKYNAQWLALFEQMERVRKPVIASVHGFAPAGGTEITLACDLVIASDDAQFALAEMNVGIFPGAGAPIRLTRWVGRARAKEILFTGDFITAKQALEWGLVNRVVDRQKLRDETMAFAEKLCRKAPLALGAAKAAVNIGAEMEMDKGIQYALQEFLLLFTTKDQEEGIRAFLERRDPNFEGR